MEASIATRLLGPVLSHPIASLAILITSYLALLIGYRLTLHPLAKYPGPKIAAITLWYEFYHDCIRRGQYTFEIKRMHDEYGPVVRISPNELHVNEPAFIDELYAGGSKKREKSQFYVGQFGITGSTFATANHDLHRLRRGALNNFFSKAYVSKLEPMIYDAAEKLGAHLQQTYAASGKPASLDKAFSCLTADVITEYAFAKSYDFLRSPTFEPNLKKALVGSTELSAVFKHLPWLLNLKYVVPLKLVSAINSELGVFTQFQMDIQQQIRTFEAEVLRGEYKQNAYRTIFHDLIFSDLPEEEKHFSRIWQEGQVLVAAGTETTARALSVAFFHLLDNPQTMAKLQLELGEAMPTPGHRLSWSRLEALPYLNAVIYEALRLSLGISTRLQRVNPIGSMYLKTSWGGRQVEYEIPRGTAVGMTSTIVHFNPQLFPDPSTFRPERWLDKDGNRDIYLDKYLLSFSRGSRQCAGMNLAYAEIFIVIAYLVRSFGSRMELFETTKEDVEVICDLFIPGVKKGSKGVQVIIQ